MATVRIDAELREPYGIAVDTGGTLYIADHRMGFVLKVERDGSVTRIVGDD